MDKRSKGGSSRNAFNPGRTVDESHEDSDPSVTGTVDQEEEDLEYARNMGRSGRRSITMNVSSLSPSFAAAMLSLPWPPKQKSKKDKNGSDGEESLSDTEQFRQVSKIPSKAGEVKSSHSRKMYRKKKSKSSYRTEQQWIEREYRPFAIPGFHEVHTGWPGFEHEPISNWEEKYMVAKPYPRKAGGAPSSSSKSGILSSPSVVINNNNDAVEYSDKEGGDDGEEEKIEEGKSQSKTSTKGSKPRRRVYVERVGSCVR